MKVANSLGEGSQSPCRHIAHNVSPDSHLGGFDANDLGSWLSTPEQRPILDFNPLAGRFGYRIAARSTVEPAETMIGGKHSHAKPCISEPIQSQMQISHCAGDQPEQIIGVVFTELVNFRRADNQHFDMFEMIQIFGPK